MQLSQAEPRASQEGGRGALSPASPSAAGGRRPVRPGGRLHPRGREDRAAQGSLVRAELQHQPGAVVRLGDDHASGGGVRFPNPLLGIASFAVVTTLGVVLLTGAVLPRWVWLGLQAGVTFGVVFVHWLIYQSLYVIGALCPYCMVVWAVTIPLFLSRHPAQPPPAPGGVAALRLPPGRPDGLVPGDRRVDRRAVLVVLEHSDLVVACVNDIHGDFGYMASFVLYKRDRYLCPVQPVAGGSSVAPFS